MSFFLRFFLLTLLALSIGAGLVLGPAVSQPGQIQGGQISADTSGNIVIPSSAGGAITIGVDNVILGDGAGAALTEGNRNTVIGDFAGDTFTTQSNNTMVGSEAGDEATSSNSTLIGRQAGRFVNNPVTAVGAQSASFSSGNRYTGFNLVAIGRASARYLDGTNIVAIGTNAATGVDGTSTASSLAAVGAFALQDVTTGGDNTAIGSLALTNLTTGDSNTAIGAGAGDNLAMTGANNILIGRNADVDTAGRATTFVAGRNAKPTADKQIVFGTDPTFGFEFTDLWLGWGVEHTSATPGSFTIHSSGAVAASGDPGMDLDLQPGAGDGAGVNGILRLLDAAGAAIASLDVGDFQVGSDVRFRRDVNAGLTASTTQIQGNGALTADVNEVATVANINDTVTLPVAIVGAEIYVVNNGANDLQIFPASGDNLGLGVDTATVLLPTLNIRFVAIDDTNWEQF